MGDDQRHRACRGGGPRPADPIDALAAGVGRGGRLDIEIGGGRLLSWSTRRQLRRRQGIVATHVAGPRWILRRPPA